MVDMDLHRKIIEFAVTQFVKLGLVESRDDSHFYPE